MKITNEDIRSLACDKVLSSHSWHMFTVWLVTFGIILLDCSIDNIMTRIIAYAWVGVILAFGVYLYYKVRRTYIELRNDANIKGIEYINKGGEN